MAMSFYAFILFVVDDKAFMVVFSILLQFQWTLSDILGHHLYWVCHLHIYIYINNNLKSR